MLAILVAGPGREVAPGGEPLPRRRPDAALLRGRCPPYGEGITYWPLVGVAGRRSARTGGRNPGDDEPRPRFATAQARTSPRPRPARSSRPPAPGGLARRGWPAACTLVLEDRPSAEPAMLDLAEELAALPGVALRSPRGARSSSTPAGSCDRRRGSAPAARAACAGAVRRSAAPGTLAPDLPEEDRDRLLAAAEGNPLRHRPDRPPPGRGRRPGALPPDLEAVLQARVERLSPEERSVAERAALMGREFWEDGLGALDPQAPPPRTALAALARRELVAEGRADGAPSIELAHALAGLRRPRARPCSFTNGLVRDVVYQSVPKLRRADLHERLAAAQESGGRARTRSWPSTSSGAARLRARAAPQGGAQPGPPGRRAPRARRRAGPRFARTGPAARALLTRAAALLEDDEAARSRIERQPRRGRAAAPVPGIELVARGCASPATASLGSPGAAGMGVVYRGRGPRARPAGGTEGDRAPVARDPRFRERFARESRIAARLEHPHVVPGLPRRRGAGALFIAMRFVDGHRPGGAGAGGGLAPERATALVAQIAEALDAAHARGLVHRDVKPANVLVTGSGEAEHAYLTDFGLTMERAARAGSPRPASGWAPSPTSRPSRSAREGVDARADVYALGGGALPVPHGPTCPSRSRTELEALGAHLDEPPPKPSAHGAPRLVRSRHRAGDGEGPRRRATARRATSGGRPLAAAPAASAPGSPSAAWPRGRPLR